MKKFSKTLIMVLIAFSLVACGSGGESKDGEVKIALLLSGNLGDMSFLDSANKGIEEIKKNNENVHVQVVEMGSDATKYESNVIDFSENNYDIIIGSGWQLQEPFEKHAGNYPETQYIIFDAEVNYEDNDLKNVYSITYKSNEVSFLAGVLAAKTSETGKIGFLGGADGPGINDFLVGYIEGAKSVNPDIKVITGYIGGFSDSPKAKEMSLAQYNQGVDVIFTAAGASGIGTLEAAAAQGKWAIGVDSDQAMLFKESNPAISEQVPSSTLKNVDASLVRAFDLFTKGELATGKAESLGLKEGAVSLTENEYYEKLVSDDVKDLLATVREDIISGSQAVSTAFGMTNDELSELINSVKP